MAARATSKTISRALVARGPVAVERAVEELVLEDLGRVRSDPKLLRAPLVVVVPSRSLRQHLGRKIAAWSDGASAGVRVTTLFGLARELCTASGTAVPRGARMFDPLVARSLERGDELGLSSFEDGARVAALTVADLVDAGFEPDHVPRLRDALVKAERSRVATQREIARANALLDVAADVVRASDAIGVGRPAQMLKCATAALEHDAKLLRARGILIHGFSDATGAAAGLLAALVERCSAQVVWDACADGVFGRELRQRLGVDAAAVPLVQPAPCTLTRASSVDLEARAAVDRIKSILDSGVQPESIGVVARDLGPYRVALRRHCTRLSIPFSGQGATRPDGPAERSARALAECVARAGACSIDRWHDARATGSYAGSKVRPYELRIAMRALGVGTLSELAQMTVDTALQGSAVLRLPLRGITTVEECEPEPNRDEAAESGEEEEEPEEAGEETLSAQRASDAQKRRTVDRADLQREVALAIDSLHALENLPASAPIGGFLQRVRTFAADTLAWETDGASMRIFELAAQALSSDLPQEVRLGAEAFRSIFERELGAQSAQPLGGEGGGIACLNVVEARARTFDSLFVLGLVRGRFPRNVREDPLLPDALRASWQSVVPHLLEKSAGRDEERALFDQLVRSAREVHLSWPTLDAESKVLLPSSLLERVASPQEIAGTPLEGDALSSPDGAGIRPAYEHAVSAGLHGRIDGLEALLPLALAATRAFYELSPTSANEIAAARIAVLREHEPAPAEKATLGPYFGLIGKLARPDDRRRGDLHVTQLEAVAACGWKALLQKLLRIEPALDPLATLPDLDPRLVGDVVHAVLQVVVERMTEGVRWPEPSEVDAILFREARAGLRERGLFVPGFEVLVAARARPMLDAARAIDEDERASIRSARSEITGGLDLPEGALGTRRLLFRADRVDDLGTARRFTDYKTGKPLSDAQGADTRHKHLIAGIARGTHLQAMAYALGAGPGGIGRYVFLAEGAEMEKRVFAVDAASEPAQTAFDDAIERVLGALDMGALFPRLLSPDAQRTNRLCDRCEMAQACLRGDSGANRRLARFVTAAAPNDTRPGTTVQLAVAHEAALRLWSLSTAKAPELPKEPVEPAIKRKKRSGNSE